MLLGLTHELEYFREDILWNEVLVLHNDPDVDV
jgi:hypothetical protein